MIHERQHPMTPPPAEIVAALRGESKDWGDGMATVGTDLLITAADLIETLSADRDGLAWIVAQMREALGEAIWYVQWEREDLQADSSCGADEWYGEALKDEALCTNALALDLPEAVAKVQEWREKAELLDWANKHVYSVDRSGIGADDSWVEVLYMDGNKAEGATLIETLQSANEAENVK